MCPIKDDLFSYLDGELGDDEVEQIDRHLKECAACQHEMTLLREVVAGFTSLRSTPTRKSVEQPGSRSAGSGSDVRLFSDPEAKEISDDQISGLRVALAVRDFQIAGEIIDQHYDTLHDLDIDQNNAAPLVGLFGRWMDMGNAHIGAGRDTDRSRLEMLKHCLSLFPQPPRGSMSLRDITYLRMASGYAALAEQRDADASEDFSFVTAVGAELRDKELDALANFGLAKIHRRNGRYDEAKPFLSAAIRLADEAVRPQLKAGFQIMHAWLLFQKGKIMGTDRIVGGKRANSLGAKEELEEAEAVLRAGQDRLRLGNIRSAFGRIAQREGRYHDALRLHDEALIEYRAWSKEHPNNARTLVNRAFATRLLYLKRRQGGCFHKRDEESSRQLAERDLAEALELYSALNNNRGKGHVKAVTALLQMDAGELEEAEQNAAEAYHLGVELCDRILMTRARLVQCMIAHEKIGGTSVAADSVDSHRERALSFALDAVNTAAKTENRHLQARSHTWHGLTLVKLGRIDEAKEACTKARRKLKQCGGDARAAEFQTLAKEVGFHKPIPFMPKTLNSARQEKIV